jgi:hypothetical protein
MSAYGMEIRGVHHSWAVYHNGRKVREVTGGMAAAEAVAHNLERAARPKLNRPCLCCRSIFASEGPHNRMCDECRKLT